MTSEVTALSATPSLPPRGALKPAALTELQLLGQGPGARVWRALSPEGQPVLLKTFSLADAPSWKAYELFEREARVLQHLLHPHLPRLLAYGCEDQQSYLIYAYVPGQSLEQKLAAGWRPTLSEALGLMRQLLDTLAWLHSHQPPIIHRDIKPSNLILTPEQQLYLIDFGAVLLHLKPQGGSTVAGTFGYMAPEQLTGRSLPASDLYAVGATLIHLLTGLSPSELPQERLWIRFEEHVQLSTALRAWVHSLIHPVVEERCPDAWAALAALERATSAQMGQPLGPGFKGPLNVNPLVLLPPPQPLGGQAPIQFCYQGQALEISLPIRRQPLGPGQFVGIGGAGMLLAFIFSRLLIGVTHPSWLVMACFFSLLLAANQLKQHRRQAHKPQTPVQLRLTAETLTVSARYGTGYPYEIPWEMLDTLRLRRHQRGLLLRFRDPSMGRRRLLRIGQGLQAEEQAWLAELLLRQHTTSLGQSKPPRGT